jgi:hypothetical protein
MKTQLVSVLIWAVALFAPLVFFLELAGNLNERMQWLPFVICIPLCIVAAKLTSGNKSFWVWGGIIGLAEAVLLAFFF